MNPDDITAVSNRATCLHNAERVEAVLDNMAAAITAKLADQNPVLLTVMNGGVIVSGKLATRLDFPLQMDYLHASRYRNKTHGSELQWKHYPEVSLAGRVVLVIDDILDEGETLAAIIDYVRGQGAAAVHTAVLVNKMHARKAPGVSADFVGLEIEDYYLYGYGMDYRGYLRNAPGIFAVDPDDCD